jgi:putative ABC transport system ATP-binding protein
MSYIEVLGIVKSFKDSGKQVDVLNGASFAMNKGQTASIIGKSGSGKSTLLTIMAGIETPDQGAVNIDGTNLFSLKEKELTQFRSKNLGIIFQHYHLVKHLTAIENVQLPLLILGEQSRIAYEKAAHLIEQVGLKDRMKHFPDQLSGGECQRVAIARSLIYESKLILADEPTGSLDVQTGEQVMAMLFDLVSKHKKNLILVTHDLDLAKQCELMLTLNQGKIVL